MDIETKNQLSELILQIVKIFQADDESWVNLVEIGKQLSAKDVKYGKLKIFLHQFEDILEFKEERPDENRPPISYARLKNTLSVYNTAQRAEAGSHVPVREPKEKTKLWEWASIPSDKYAALANLALKEKWSYGTNAGDGQEDFPILKSYINYTFMRLCFEKKVIISKDEERNEEYAAFNTGLVDKKYDYIYALFKQNTIHPFPYWYLVSFVVAGEDAGKTLNRIFNPLPAKADYFENNIANMLFDTSTGDLICDSTHIITQRTYRLPKEFLKQNCPASILEIDGMNLDNVDDCNDFEQQKAYFEKLGQAIRENARVFRDLKNRFDNALEFAKKQTEWNYKTAIPTYYPRRNTGALLLPLALTGDQADVALVVTRNPSGSYQGETILTLEMAYSNSRLITRPDNEWLNIDAINAQSESDIDD